MNMYMMLAMILANVIAISLVYQFIKKLPKKEIIVFLAISVGTMYILISIVYWISGLGIENSVHETSKNFVTYLFVPVNVILFIPYIAVQYHKVKQNKMSKQQLQKKAITLGILLILVLLLEYFYFGSIQNNIAKRKKEKEEEAKQETVIQNQETNTLYENEIQKPEIENEIRTNER